MSGVVLDASAVLAFLLKEPGAELVVEVINDALISSVNLAEVIGYFAKKGASAATIRGLLTLLPVVVVPFDQKLAYAAGLLRPISEKVGLSIGDRACLMLAKQRGAAAYTADRAWKKIEDECGVVIVLVR